MEKEWLDWEWLMNLMNVLRLQGEITIGLEREAQDRLMTFKPNNIVCKKLSDIEISRAIEREYIKREPI